MIRQATVQDIPTILRIYDAARAFMRHTGNMTQWSAAIRRRRSYAQIFCRV